MIELPLMQLKTMEITFLYANTEVVGLGEDIVRKHKFLLTIAIR